MIKSSLTRNSSQTAAPADDQLIAQASKSSYVMGWARDIATGEPVYILELDRTRTGAQCGCECPSCDLPLIAVNAAKSEYFRRPHFRHPNGAEKNECMHLSARLAALYLLKEQGVFQLPRRRVLGHVLGNSGTLHEAYAERPPERVRIRDFNFLDKIVAILTLEDGRELRIQLTGTGSHSESTITDSLPMATIFFDINDASIASMSPDELRSRITLVNENLCWLSHFDDHELKNQALEEAKRLADELMDLQPFDDSIFVGLNPKLRRETLLHFEVKRILSESKEIMLPALQAKAHESANNGKSVESYWERPSELMPLIDVQLEQRLGCVVPDVIARIPPERGEIMLIEVTVTNHIDDERLMRIQQINHSTLEIDLSFSSGLISRSDLKRWVVHGLDTKRWLHHPEMQMQKRILEFDVQSKVKEINEAERDAHEARKLVLAIPLEKIANDFVTAIYKFAEFDREVVVDDAKRFEIDQAKKDVNDLAEKLSIHGYPEASDQKLTHGRKAIVARILSIKLGRGVGYQLNSTMEVLNAIRQSSNNNSSNHTLYLIAEKAYRNCDSTIRPDWYLSWVNAIKASIGKNEVTYLRDGKYDRLLSLLFPEISRGLSNGYGKTPLHSNLSFDGNSRSRRSNPEMERIRGFYKDGEFRHYAPKIMFDDVLHEAEAINRGETFAKWFEIWSDRYKLYYDLNPIAQFLYAAGFVEAMNQWHSWNTHVKKIKASGRLQLERTEITSFTTEETTPVVNLYALEKGRGKPRAG